MSNTQTITPAQARKELARREAKKGTAKRNARPAKHIFDAKSAELRAIAGVTPASTPAQTKPAMGYAGLPANVRASIANVQKHGLVVSVPERKITSITEHFPTSARYFA